ncbi:KRI1-like family C-terminal-domain-containing protein [Mycena rosella]|uniref:KRI1-like family C-terminal-domain-containing protein n=1 Tax=Mycena rosella TaxID=1033263 RepID=A0AAD7FXQ4_MYCRO|nr:KRI1-like family C-terminal-domain-containing protein [Mycena rosella]
MLSESESESDHEQDSLHQLTINEHYAKAFEYKKEREELQRLKEQYGSDPDSSEDESTDSEELESEDSDGEELTPAMDAAILRTLARIKRKDPGIYEEGKNIFGEEQEKTTKSANAILSRPAGPVKEPKDKSKPLTIRAANLQSALLSRSPSPERVDAPVTHVEEQRRLRDETIAAFHAVDGDEEEDFLVPREKTMDEVAREEEEYRQFLEKEVGDLRDLVDVGGGSATVEEPQGEEGTKKKKKKKKEKKGNEEGSSNAAGSSKQDQDQEFLVNYILNRGWIDRASKRVPTYGEVTSQSKKGKAKAQATDDADDSGSEGGAGEDDSEEEEVFDDILDRFESSYNFRFEETDGSQIKSYPRNLPSLVRREDTTRKDARERRKQRKEEELAKRKEEVRRLKGLKVKEIRARLEKAGVSTGTAESLEELGIDLDAPWNPEEHDQQMQKLYELNGAEDDDAEFENDDEKPMWGDDVDIGDIPMSPSFGPSTSKAEKKKKKKKKKGGEDEDEGVDIDAMDADVVPLGGDDDEEWDGTEEMRKRKLDEWMNEVYALDFNDIVGGIPTRFHYTSVAPQNFALTPAEILLAKDSELNEYMGVKKYAPYRADNKAGWDHNRGDRLRELKAKVKERMGGVDVEPSGRDGQVKKKRKGKKERMKDKGGDVDGAVGADDGEANGVVEGDLKRKRDVEDEDAAGDAGQPTEGGKKKRRRKKKDAAAEV